MQLLSKSISCLHRAKPLAKQSNGQYHGEVLITHMAITKIAMHTKRL